MSKLSKVSDQLMGLTMSELTQVQKMVQDIKTMKSDIRLQDRIIKDVETSVKEIDRQLHQDLKQLEEELDINIKKALSNPLAGTK